MPKCPKCSNEGSIKFGFVGSKQRWFCKPCQYRFTRTTPRGKPRALKSLAVLLHGFGLSYNAIWKIVGISTQSVINWVRESTKTLKTIELKTPVDVIELDEMWHFIDKKRQSNGFGKRLMLLQVDYSTGNWVVGVQKP